MQPRPDTVTTVGEALASATRRIAAVVDDPRLEAEVLLAQVLGCDRSRLYAWPDATLTNAQQQRFEALVAARAAGTPIAHLTGVREFWSLPLEVTADTLIPRPETELLVERALALIPANAGWRIADLGTGTGAVALAIAGERPDCALVATDRSAAALAVAARNACRLGITNVSLVQADWCHGLAAAAFDLVVANPPYVAAGDPHLERGDLRFEPPTALVAGPEGLDAIRLIVEQARACLRPGGHLLLEHGYDQGAAVRQLMATRGYGEIRSFSDLAGLDRITGGRWS